ncbi:NAD(P)-dependent oxidoreductase [Ruegeria hyattellae]|uniref:NAD(P)-dependent oxidoreductase n=1 Tax=Ruegeria hyattellae TaxID=3233337 RepID=UPI00355BD8BB
MDKVPALDGKNIGFLGVGAMGSGMCLNLLKKGAKVGFLESKAAKNTELIEAGAVTYSSIAELAGNSTEVILCLPSSVEVMELCLGDIGVVAHIGTGNIIIDTTSSFPAETLKLHEVCKQAGVRLVDAPLTRNPEDARVGRLNCVVGASDEDFAAVKPIFDAYCENVVHAGEVSAGHRIKVLNNALSLSCAAVVSEVCAVARASGADLEKLLELAVLGGANSPQFVGMMRYHLDGDKKALGFGIALAAKDLNYFNIMAEEAGLTTRLSPHTGAYLNDARDSGFGAKTLPALIDFVEPGLKT